ncbi:MAG: nucleotidyltransferase domain-containing protein [Bdellovibrionaceae bacterium]|nr:nucleotidyltransferase domain-containing protein [Pseudobdellovibrionaceae bacterium]
MRISDKERQIIVAEIQKLDERAEVWLFGSRLDDLLKGGDIDLVVVSEKIGFSEKLDLLVNIKMQVGDQKIDLHVIPPSEKTTNLFARDVLAKAKRL